MGVTAAKLHLVSKAELDKPDLEIQELDDGWWTRSRDDGAPRTLALLALAGAAVVAWRRRQDAR